MVKNIKPFFNVSHKCLQKIKILKLENRSLKNFFLKKKKLLHRKSAHFVEKF